MFLRLAHRVSRRALIPLVLAALSAPLPSCAAVQAVGETAERGVSTAGGYALRLAMSDKAALQDDEDDKSFTNSRRIPLHAQNLDEERLGALLYQGGLHLFDEDEDFGGLSGLLVSPDGKHFLAVSDKAFWVSGDLAYRRGELIGVRNIDVKRMRDLDGKKIEDKEWGDAESLIGTIGGEVFVSFERRHRIWRYTLSGKDWHKAPAIEVDLPREVEELKSNSGLEGITFLKDGSRSLLLVSEDTRDAEGNSLGWLVRPGGFFALAVKDNPPFKVTDLATLPNGDVLLLERRYTPAAGPGYQIRRVAGETIQPGAVLDGPVLARASLPYSLDNMEGLDVRVDERGHVLLYIVSDDNYNPLQRTLLLTFRLMDDGVTD